MNGPEAKTLHKRNVKGQASYDAVVHAAMHAFSERGYAGTRVEDIVTPAGRTEGAYYQYFANKEECFWAVAAYREQRRAGWHEAVLSESSEDLATIIGAALRRLSELSEGHEAWTRVMAGFYERHRADPQATTRLRSAYAGWMGELGTFVAELQRRGLVDQGRDAMSLATDIYAFAEGLAVHALIFGMDPAARDEAMVHGIVRLLGGEH